MKSASDSARVGAAGPSLIRSPLQLMTATVPCGAALRFRSVHSAACSAAGRRPV